MEKECPWWFNDFIMFGTFLGGMLLVILGALMQIGGILPEIEILLKIFLRVFITSYVIRGLMILIIRLCNSYIPFSVEFTALEIIVALGSVAGASAWLLIITSMLN